MISLCSRSGIQTCPSNACVGDSNKRKMAMCGESRVTLKASQGSDISNRYLFIFYTVSCIMPHEIIFVWHSNTMPSCVLRPASCNLSTCNLLDSIVWEVCVCACVSTSARSCMYCFAFIITVQFMWQAVVDSSCTCPDITPLLSHLTTPLSILSTLLAGEDW